MDLPYLQASCTPATIQTAASQKVEESKIQLLAELQILYAVFQGQGGAY
jgi:hypothetical protein